MSDESPPDSYGINLDDWVDMVLGEELGSFLVKTAHSQEKARSFSLEVSKDRSMRDLERIELAQNLLKDYIRPCSELAKAWGVPRERLMEVLVVTDRVDLATFASWIAYHHKEMKTLSAAQDYILKWFSDDPRRRMPNVSALAADSIVFAQIAEDISKFNETRDKVISKIRGHLPHISASMDGKEKIVDRAYSTRVIPMKEAEKVVGAILESERPRISRTTWLTDFRDGLFGLESSENEIGLAIVANWLTSYLRGSEASEASESVSHDQFSLSRGIEPGFREHSASKDLVVVLHKDYTGEYHAADESSKKALDEGAQLVIRPHELNKNLGIQLESAQFQTNEPKIPNWLWLNYFSGQDRAVEESSLFLASNREPPYRNIWMTHQWLHKALVGLTNREYLKKQPEPLGNTLTRIVQDILIKEDKRSIDVLQRMFSEEIARSASYEPVFLLELTTEQRGQGRTEYVDIEGWGELRREYVASAGFPWILNSASHMTKLLSRLYSLRLRQPRSLIFPRRMVSRFQEKAIIVLTGFPEGPETARMKTIGFIESEEGEFTIAEISRKYEALIQRQNPRRLGLSPQPSLRRMSAKDSQMVFDRLPN
ncbi:MAG: hypothetical protein ACXAEI_03105 [Candidatus Hodarchaeales archaeon]|jgi:hypothetical protein